jgi:putative hydrolase of the HAD superfamily
MIKALFFDAAGTLFHLEGSVGVHYALVARGLGAELSPVVLDRAFAHAWKQAPRRAATAGCREDDDKRWWRDLVNVLLDQIENVPPEFNRALFFENAYAHFARPDVWKLYPEVVEVLQVLAPKLPLFIVSNFDRRLHTILQNLGIAAFFRRVFISSELGADKPDPEIFRRALQQSGFAAGEVLHAGDDRKRDWEAARESGLTVFELDREKKSLRDLVPLVDSD